MSSIRMHPDRIYKITGMFVYEDQIYALHSGKKGRATQFIDTYKTESGEYVETWKSDLPLFSIAVNQQGDIAALYYDEKEEIRLGLLELDKNNK